MTEELKPANDYSNDTTNMSDVVEVPKVEEGETVEGYTPTFNDATRTVLYVVCAILGLLGAASTIVAVSTGAPSWLVIGSAMCGFAAPYIANVFGVAYNPLKMNSK